MITAFISGLKLLIAIVSAGYFFKGYLNKHPVASFVAGIIVIVSTISLIPTVIGYTNRTDAKMSNASSQFPARPPDADDTRYREALACIETSCVFKLCLSKYSDAFPFGRHSDELKAAAETEANSDRCSPTLISAPTGRARCTTINNIQICG